MAGHTCEEFATPQAGGTIRFLGILRKGATAKIGKFLGIWRKEPKGVLLGHAVFELELGRNWTLFGFEIDVFIVG
jgi:hypothetical protein